VLRELPRPLPGAAGKLEDVPARSEVLERSDEVRARSGVECARLVVLARAGPIVSRLLGEKRVEIVRRHGTDLKVPCMPTFVLRLIAPRPNFAETLTDSEREIMNRHAAHWRPYLERGDMVAFGPILTDEDSYGLAVVETDDEQALREFAAQDPVVTTGTAAFEFGRMAAGHVRGR